MDKKKIISFVVGGTLLLVTAFGAVTYQVVKAQAAAVTPAPNTATQSLPGKGMGNGGGYTDQELASALGITTDQLSTAEQSATTEALKQAVAAGLITQAQADQYANGNAGGHPMGGLPFLNNSAVDTDALLAKALGISTDALKAAQQKAVDANLAQAVQSGSMTQDQADLAKASYILANNAAFQTAVKAGRDAAVKQAVTDGLITQAQADGYLANTTGAGVDNHSGRGGPGGNVPGLAPANPSSSSTSTQPDFFTLLAKALGISADQFQSAYQKAYNASLDQAVQNGTMTQTQANQAKANYALQNSAKFQSAVKASYDAAVKQAVTDGVINQAQADLVIKNSAGIGMNGFSNPAGLGNPGGFGGRGGPHGNMPGNPPSANPATPSATPTTVP